MLAITEAHGQPEVGFSTSQVAPGFVGTVPTVTFDDREWVVEGIRGHAQGWASTLGL